MTSLSHVGITVSDLERSVRFYSKGLGFEEVVRQTSDAPYLALTGYPGVEIAAALVRLPDGDLTLELQEYRRVDAGAPREAGTAAVGSSHLSLSVDDLGAALERAERFGGGRVTAPVAIDRGINAGARAVYVRDPDGYTIELVQPTAAGSGCRQGAI
jgi:catechol 2,3-dioxygenase-like lactoylglutathione lyase family enzyme